jgi:hypothetical protein
VSFPPVPGGIFSRSNVPDPTAANQYPVSNSSDKWTLSGVGTIGGNTYNAGWTVSTADLGGEALYSSASGGTATIPLNLTSAVGETAAFRQLGAGQLTVAGASGVTVEGTLVTTGQYQVLFARQVAANVWAVTASQGTGGSQAVSSVFGRTGAIVAVTADYTVAQVTGAAPSASPTFTGTPAAPSALISDTTTQLATDGFVSSLLAAGNANQFGYLGWTTDPVLCAAGAKPVSGQLVLIRFRAAASGTIGHIVYNLLLAGSGLTSAENWLGVYDTGQTTAGSATLIGDTADQTSNFAGTGPVSAAIATGTPAVVAGEDYFAGVLVNASTRPQFVASMGNVIQGPTVNQGLSGLGLRLANGNTTYTTLPSAVTAANLSGTSQANLAGISFILAT